MIRFKTKEEFEAEYGRGWREQKKLDGVHFPERMDSLLGQRFEPMRPPVNGAGDYDKYKGRWTVEPWMLTDKPLPATEKDSRPKWRFKTKREFENEYGNEWRNSPGSGWSSRGGMDHLLGWVISDHDYEIIDKAHWADLLTLSLGPVEKDNRWAFSTRMFTPCDYTKGRVGDDGYWVEDGARYEIRAGDLKEADQLPDDKYTFRVKVNKHPMGAYSATGEPMSLDSLRRDYGRHFTRIGRIWRMKNYISKITTK